MVVYGLIAPSYRAVLVGGGLCGKALWDAWFPVVMSIVLYLRGPPSLPLINWEH